MRVAVVIFARVDDLDALGPSRCWPGHGAIAELRAGGGEIVERGGPVFRGTRAAGP